MKGYNGFTATERNQAQYWLNQQWKAGTLERPHTCVACGQDHGVIDAHAEDYSKPFRAGVTDAFHLCFACHMIVHCRHRNETRWIEYRELVEAGHRLAKPFTRRDWPGFMATILAPRLDAGLFLKVDPQPRRALLEIELSQNEVAQRLRAGGFAERP